MRLVALRLTHVLDFRDFLAVALLKTSIMSAVETLGMENEAADLCLCALVCMYVFVFLHSCVRVGLGVSERVSL